MKNTIKIGNKTVKATGFSAADVLAAYNYGLYQGKRDGYEKAIDAMETMKTATEACMDKTKEGLKDLKKTCNKTEREALAVCDALAELCGQCEETGEECATGTDEEATDEEATDKVEEFIELLQGMLGIDNVKAVRVSRKDGE